VGVALVDGHVDVYDGRLSPTGEAADMPMSVALGLGPQAWVDAAGGVSADPARYVALGARDPEEARDIAPLLAGPLADIEILPPGELRAEGIARAAIRATERLGPFFVHLDVDVLGEDAMPATDYLMPDGLDWDELAQLLAPLGASENLVGFSLGCLNPEKDPGGACTERTVALLETALSGTSASR
jgi:arginase